MMNENNKPNIISSKRQLAGAVVSCIAVAVLIAAGVTSSVVKNRENVTLPEVTTVLVTQKQAANNVKNQPDERDKVTVVPRTVSSAEETSAVPETTTQKAAPTYYVLPLGTDIGSDYNAEVPVFNAVMGDWRTHCGIDFNCAYGDGVKAVAEGVVNSVYDDTVWGTVAEINHGGGIVSKYCGLQGQTLNIKTGDSVSAGTCIGYVGEIPCEKDADKAHIHFEMSKDGKTSDPMEIMGRMNDTD